MIAIKGIEMPTCCCSCGFARFSDDSNKASYCTIVFKRVDLSCSDRPNWCPLVEVSTKEDNDDIHCPCYTLRTETRYLSDAEMCELYKLTGKIKRSAKREIGYCMGTREIEECHCHGLKERCDHK